MSNSSQKKFSEVLTISEDFLISFEEVIPKALASVRSEILSNPKFHELIGNNPQKILDDLIQSHLKIFQISIQFDNMNILTKGLSHLYRYCLNRGFSEELLKIEFFSLDNALNTFIKYNKDEIKKINEEIYEKFKNIIYPIDLSEKKYGTNDKDEEFIRNFTSKLIDIDYNKTEMMVKSYIIDDENRERLYDQIIYHSVELIRDLFENFIIDESQTKVILSILNRVISSIYISKSKDSDKNIYIIHLPTEGILGMNLYSLFHKIQSQILADMLDFKGFCSLCINYEQGSNLNIIKNPDFIIFWGVTPYNFSLFRDVQKLLNYKFPNLRSLIHIEDLEQNDIKSYRQNVNNFKKILEVISNDKEIF